MTLEDQQMEALKGALAAALPDMITTRSFVPISQRPIEDLEKGVVTLVRLGEKEFANYMGREADLGTVNAMLAIQFKLSDSAEGLAVEQREIECAKAVRAVLASPLPPPLIGCLATGYKQSGQLECPFGWVLFELEIQS